MAVCLAPAGASGPAVAGEARGRRGMMPASSARFAARPPCALCRSRWQPPALRG